MNLPTKLAANLTQMALLQCRGPLHKGLEGLGPKDGQLWAKGDSQPLLLGPQYPAVRMPQALHLWIQALALK
jgi:hypothetical protein